MKNKNGKIKQLGEIRNRQDYIRATIFSLNEETEELEKKANKIINELIE